jgi:hypothetical protein
MDLALKKPALMARMSLQPATEVGLKVEVGTEFGTEVALEVATELD